MASQAEARIREKAERLLRDSFPGARIVHEFDLGGVRLDLAAITEDRLAVLEIKSELDTLSRLERQVKFGLRIGGPVLVCYAPKWEEPIRALDFADRWRVEWLMETDDGFSGLGHRRITADHDRYDNRALFWLLLKPELLALARPHGGKVRHTVPELQSIVHENLTGREIRRGVMAALRARRFGWTCDEPIGAARIAA
jgi:hypothetical protein